jgi:hypothetical protein
VCDSKSKPEKLRDLKSQEKQAVHAREAINQVANDMRRQGHVISSAKAVQVVVKDKTAIEVSVKLVRQVLRQDCQLGFVKAKKSNP